MAKFLIFLFTMTSISHAFALEINPFRDRDKMLADKEAGTRNLYLLNDKINLEIRNVVEQFNATKNTCTNDLKAKSPPPMIHGFLSTAWGGVPAKIEDWVEDNDNIKKTPYKESIGDYGIYDRFWGILGKGASTMNVGGVIIGTDKIGHFIADTSLHPFTYSQYHFRNSLKHTFKYSQTKEEGLLGLESSGVKSYADIAANTAGVKFWANFASYKGSGRNTYIVCNEKTHKYEINRDFDFSPYINELWDEGLNCSVFHSTPVPYKSKTMPRKPELSEEGLAYMKYMKENGYQCPVDKNFCKEQAQKKCATYLLTPKCFKDYIPNEVCKRSDLMKLPSTNTSGYQYDRSDNKSPKGSRVIER